MNEKSVVKSNEILKLESNGNLIAKWLKWDDHGRLSVTQESTIILSVFMKQKVNEYSSVGFLIKEMKLSSIAGKIQPRHAIKLTSGHYVVSHGDFLDPRQRVCVVSGSGEGKKFGGKKGSNMAVYKDGFVMVADRENGRVLLLTQISNTGERFYPEIKTGYGFTREDLSRRIKRKTMRS